MNETTVTTVKAAIAAAVADTLEGNGTPSCFMIRTRKASIRGRLRLQRM